VVGARGRGPPVRVAQPAVLAANRLRCAHGPLMELVCQLENETGSPSPGARSPAKAGSQPPAMPERQGSLICRAPR
jgi:hypothetical protein